MKKQIGSGKKLGIAVALILLFLFPNFASSNYIISVGVTFCTYACFATSWNLIGGYADQISWCHSSFVAVGAYTSVILFRNFSLSPWLGMFVGVVISIVAALIIGLISFRLRGPFFALVTIAFAEIVRVWLLYAKNLTRGAEGLVVTFKGENWKNLMFQNDKAFYYIMAVLLVVFVVISWRIERTKTGYYLRAIKADEDATESLGINTNKVKLIVFIISAMMTSIAGTFFAFFLSYIDPASVSSMDLATKVVAMAIVGGAGTLFGPVIGALVLVPFSEFANVLLGSSGSGTLLYGLLLILVIIFKPGGIISFFTGTDSIARSKWFMKLKGGKANVSAPGN